MYNSSPIMNKRTRMLIHDHDVCSYHSFDCFRLALRLVESVETLKSLIKEEYFNDIVKFMRMDSSHQLNWYRRNAINFNFRDWFNGMDGIDDVDRLEVAIKNHMTHAMYKPTMSDVGKRFEPIFATNDTTAVLVQRPKDRVRPSLLGMTTKTSRIECEKILDYSAIADIIMAERCNALVCGNVDFAIAVSTTLETKKYKEPMAIYFGDYRYNFDDDGKMRLYDSMRVFMQAKQYEFGVIDMFTSITKFIDKEDKLRAMDEYNKQKELQNENAE